MRDIRDQINAQLYGVGVADLPARHAQLHAQLLQNAAFMDGYRKERRTMFKFVRRLIEKLAKRQGITEEKFQDSVNKESFRPKEGRRTI